MPNRQIRFLEMAAKTKNENETTKTIGKNSRIPIKGSIDPDSKDRRNGFFKANPGARRKSNVKKEGMDVMAKRKKSSRTKYGKIGPPKSAKRKKWLASIRKRRR